MQLVIGENRVQDTDALSIYDTERKAYRMTVWEEDRILHVLFSEPVVIATEEDDIVGGRYHIPR